MTGQSFEQLAISCVMNYNVIVGCWLLAVGCWLLAVRGTQLPAGGIGTEAVRARYRCRDNSINTGIRISLQRWRISLQRQELGDLND